jgi:two-component system, cell cycle response regulator
MLDSASRACDQSLVITLTQLLSAVCTRTAWEYGESWIPDVTHSVLELSPAWCVNTNLDMRRAIPWMQFQVCSQAVVLEQAEGLPGRIWQSHQPEWIEDASTQPAAYFSRHQIAKALGVKAGLGIPVLVRAQVLAVAVFFMSKPHAPDPLIRGQTQAIVRNFQYELSTRLIDRSS